MGRGHSGPDGQEGGVEFGSLGGGNLPKPDCVVTTKFLFGFREEGLRYAGGWDDARPGAHLPPGRFLLGGRREEGGMGAECGMVPFVPPTAVYLGSVERHETILRSVRLCLRDRLDLHGCGAGTM